MLTAKYLVEFYFISFKWLLYALNITLIILFSNSWKYKICNKTFVLLLFSKLLFFCDHSSHCVLKNIKAIRGAWSQSVIIKDWLWIRSPLEEMKHLFKFVLVSSLCGETWRTECLNTRFPLPVCGIQREADFFKF